MLSTPSGRRSMWHDYCREGGKSDAHWAVENFRKLSKEQRQQVIKFVDSI